MEVEPATAGDSTLPPALSPVITGLNQRYAIVLGLTPQALRLRLLRRLVILQKPRHAVFGMSDRLWCKAVLVFIPDKN